MQREIEIALSRFTPITLAEMDGVKLMDRTDTKYVFHVRHLPEVLSKLMANYRSLEVEGSRMSRYETLYYDTEDFQLYHKHQNRKLNRYKIRARNYVESDLNFFEVKFKNNKGRTIKDRIKIKEIAQVISGHEKQAGFLEQKTFLQAAHLVPKLWVNYSRITLVNNDTKERLTIDVNLHFKNDHQVKDYSYIVIAELKQERAAASVFSALMKQMVVREGSLSKYCLGAISLYPELKHNNFKPNLAYLNKLSQESYA